MSKNTLDSALIISIAFLIAIFGWSSVLETTGRTVPKNTFRGDAAEVHTIARTYTNTLMHEFNPSTGRNPRYIINSWQYTSTTDVYTIDLTASWSGKPDVWSHVCTSELTVVCQVTQDGSTFDTGQPRINACIETGQRSDLLWNAFVAQMGKNKGADRPASPWH